MKTIKVRLLRAQDILGGPVEWYFRRAVDNHLESVAFKSKGEAMAWMLSTKVDGKSYELAHEEVHNVPKTKP